MKVVCIKKYLSTSLQYELTYGKIYETLPMPISGTGGDLTYDLTYLSKDYKIKCDRGFIEYYSKSTFVTLEDWRQQQINKIVNEH
jgi:hypothetical protein